MQRERLEEWFATPQGRRLWRRESELMASLLTDCFGHHGLEIGTPSGTDDVLAASSLGHRIRLDIDAAGRLSGGIRGNLDALALRPRSLVVVVLVHVLEYLPAPAAALAAVEQALAPGGRLVAVCFDPISLPALRNRIAPARLPWWPRGACSARRCGQWIRGLQLDLEHQYRAGRPPLMSDGPWRRRLEWLDRVVPTWPMGAVYVMSASKRERAGTAIRFGDKLSRRLATPGMPRPTSSRIMDDTAA